MDEPLPAAKLRIPRSGADGKGARRGPRAEPPVARGLGRGALAFLGLRRRARCPVVAEIDAHCPTGLVTRRMSMLCEDSTSSSAMLIRDKRPKPNETKLAETKPEAA